MQDCPLLDQLRQTTWLEGGDGSAEAVGTPGGAAEDVPVCLILGTASVTAIEKKENALSTISVITRAQHIHLIAIKSQSLFTGYFSRHVAVFLSRIILQKRSTRHPVSDFVWGVDLENTK